MTYRVLFQVGTASHGRSDVALQTFFLKKKNPVEEGARDAWTENPKGTNLYYQLSKGVRVVVFFRFSFVVAIIDEKLCVELLL